MYNHGIQITSNRTLWHFRYTFWIKDTNTYSHINSSVVIRCIYFYHKRFVLKTLKSRFWNAIFHVVTTSCAILFQAWTRFLGLNIMVANILNSKHFVGKIFIFCFKYINFTIMSQQELTSFDHFLFHLCKFVFMFIPMNTSCLLCYQVNAILKSQN